MHLTYTVQRMKHELEIVQEDNERVTARMFQNGQVQCRLRYWAWEINGDRVLVQYR